jgi:hypothetical protein
MGRLRSLIRRLEDRRNPVVLVEQRDGSVAKFRVSDYGPAYINLMERHRHGLKSPDLPPEHPLITAVRNSPDPRWQASMYNEEIGDDPPVDLSESA